MGTIRLLLAISVVVAHTAPLFGLKFLSGIMSVEVFFIISGFYMSLVLSTRYQGRTCDFYFNRFVRLFPMYWLLSGGFTLLSLFYWVVIGHPLGALSALRFDHSLFHWLASSFANLFIVGSDWIELYCWRNTVEAGGLNRLLIIEQTWSIAVEILFYLLAPFILRQRIFTQILVFLLALFLRVLIWHLSGDQWSVWLYLFSPSVMVFFMGGVLAFHLMVWLNQQSWFLNSAKPVGRLLVVVLAVLIIAFTQIGFFSHQDWRFYMLIALSLPFLFMAFKNSKLDATMAEYSYPVYLGHCVVVPAIVPLRHFGIDNYLVYAVLLLTFIVSYFALQVDKRVQSRFKRVVV